MVGAQQSIRFKILRHVHRLNKDPHGGAWLCCTPIPFYVYTLNQFGNLTASIQVVTGAASGIGLATSIAFAREGAAGVALIDISSSALESALTQVKTASCRKDFIGITFVLDITDEAAVEETIERIHEKFGRIDYAVNNAGMTKGDEGGVAGTTTETWRKMIGINLEGTFFCLRAELKKMLKQERRKVSDM